jgi:two-component system KDP operon response regulator KdpE
VLDWQLPGMAGIQTCRMLRASSNVPVIMVSGNRSNSKVLAIEAGANGYLAKPFSVSDLLECIEVALRDFNH